MTNQDAVTKAINKAIDSGWNIATPFLVSADMPSQRKISFGFGDTTITYDWDTIIFNHDFCRALWSDGYTMYKGPDDINDWQYHLQKMVLSKDPVKYLREHI